MIFRAFYLSVLCLFLVDSQGQSLNDLVKKVPYPGSMGGINPGIATGSHSGKYIRVGEDMSMLCRGGPFVMPPKHPSFRLNVFSTAGGLDGMKRLAYEREVQLAIIQSDLYYYAKTATNPDHPFGAEITTEMRKSWKDLTDNIRLVLPLYTEKIHIVARHDNTDINSLMDLFTRKGKGAKARVNIGAGGSGVLVTSKLLEQAIMRRQGDVVQSWEPHYNSTSVALDKLFNKNELDAVILVGGVPFPALERFAAKKAIIEREKRLFRQAGVDVKPVMKLVGIGKEAGDIIDASGFNCFRPAEFDADDYKDLIGPQGDKPVKIETRGVTACLVTHSGYSSSKDSHKMQWVRHIVYRVLSNLDSNSETGFVRGLDPPQAGAKTWKDTAQILNNINSGKADWDEFGWRPHNDTILEDILEAGVKPSWHTTNMIDPDGRFAPY